jgi:hypothetical protein
MSNHIVILSASRLLPRAEQLAGALAPLGVEIIQTTTDSSDAQPVHQARKRSSCIILCRSPDLALAGTKWEKVVSKAFKRDSCIPVLFEPSVASDPVHPVDLSLWRGGAAAAGLPVIRDRILSSFANRRRRRWFAASAIALAAASTIYIVGALLGIYSDGTNALSGLCTYSALNRTCAKLSIGNVPSDAEEQSFQTALARGCDGLRDFIRVERDNPRIGDAQRLLAGARRVERVRWMPSEVRLSMYVSGEPKSTRTAATQSTTASARTRASELCSVSYGASPAHQLGSYSPEVELSCSSVGNGWRCSADGFAHCRINVRRTERVELCR